MANTNAKLGPVGLSKAMHGLLKTQIDVIAMLFHIFKHALIKQLGIKIELSQEGGKLIEVFGVS